MSETVCVTLEQLRQIELSGVVRLIHGPFESKGYRTCPACGRLEPNGHYEDCWLGKAIAQAERLKDWKPKIGDRVRIKAMPEAGVWRVVSVREDKSFPGSSGDAYVRVLRIVSQHGVEDWRYLAELMPEE